MSLPSRQDKGNIGTSHSNFLSPADDPADPPVAHLLRGVNWSSTAKFPSFPPRESSHPTTRKERDELRTYKTGVHTGIGEEEGRFWSEAEEGGRDGWFVGRPIEEDAADLHLTRLKAWGFNTIRYLIPWEALEHAGPGQYDEMYIDYTIRLLRKCKEHGFRVFISPHQDVFSRFMSGSGAPYWVLEAFGINPRNIHQTGAALVHACWDKEGYGGTEGIEAAKDGDEWPDMIWNTNLHRLASRHCFTMFFASDVFAPKCKIDGVPVGQWAQDHYTAAYGHLADRVRDAGGLLDNCVIGWDSMNEPDQGFIGMEVLEDIPESQDFRKGPSPTPIQGFQLGIGWSVSDVAYDDFGSLGHKKKGKVTISPAEGKGVWLTRDEAKDAQRRWGWQWSEEWNFWDENGRGGCPWAGHDVWRPSDGIVLQNGYFNPGHQGSDFINNFWKRQHASYVTRIRKAHPNGIAFINPPIFANPPDLSEQVKSGHMALSAHFYDGLTMLGKRRHRFNADAVGIQRKTKGFLSALKLGPSSIRDGLRDQFGELKSDSSKQDGIAADSAGKREYPTLIGELGTPFDMKKSGLLGLAKGSSQWGDYKEATRAMDDLLNGCDGDNALSYTLWVYEPLNSHSRGDGWNGEDLSLFSYDDCDGDDDLVADNPPDLKTLITLGSRGIQSWCRPYPVEMTGMLGYFSFDMNTTRFELEIEMPSLEGSRLWRGEREKQDISADGEMTSVGFVKIYLPFIHYLGSSTVGKENNRVIGSPQRDGAEWEKGQGKAIVDLEIEEISEGKLVVNGQWGLWTYPMQKTGDRKLTLRIKKWGGV
ncbi:glycoside hydrolase superfamily [Naematelia encephala]|uniref:Glycoside hydrolase superfamily n=1 Tax=Naematelia encephala TaxID=71784 RepID=A0A1Y2BG78_9TREE|nr:glycoside hydrolase superfamily [Naematelia encephala]